MIKILLLSFLNVYTCALIAQSTVAGKVVDKTGNPIEGANVYIVGSYDGSSSDKNGAFSFTTSLSAKQTVSISFLSFETFTKTMLVSEMDALTVVLKEDVNSLGSVVLTAGNFSAGDNSKASVLSPLDIVTTAGAAGDYIGAFQTLPGTSSVGEDGRLFVRGGDADETNVYIDDIKVFQPYNASANNLPTRGRFSPFLFKGTNFSTGGFSAEYGDALSGVLLLNTIDIPEQEKTEISLINVGLGIGHTEKWKKSSLNINTFYLNLKPYQDIVDQRVDWIKAPESFSGEAVYRKQFENGLLKIYNALSTTNFKLIQDDINVLQGIPFQLKNTNFYSNTSYSSALKKDWKLTTGTSFSLDNNHITINETKIHNTTKSFHAKLKLNKRFSNRFQWHTGIEHYVENFEERVQDPSFLNFESKVENPSTAFFTETNVFFSKKFAMKVGVRTVHNYFLDYTKISPRTSLAYQLNTTSQISLAYGDFYQAPKSDIIKYTNHLAPEKASHLILNYLYQKNGRMLRLEGYYKNYDQLVKYDTSQPEYNSSYNNLGNGYASGIDVFWKDKKSVKNFEYWLSYSYLNTKRDYKNFENSATPNFAATHTTSLVGKYWVQDWKSMVGTSLNMATGRPYNNPNTNVFQGEKTKGFSTLNLNWAYLITQQKILYLSVTNILGTPATYGYQYAHTPNSNGDFERRAIQPAADRFFLVGFFWTLSSDKKDNQLNTL
ncbi:carboxypeptidase-like regulatory domain-containing protein [Aquimarina sp. W85]|uniref:TonB-dependent receptor n=1 Tax=Aquimarina rhodophyticola TaxID=3342246 RepID=UPI00366FCA9E